MTDPPDANFNVLAIGGSLRAESYNRKLINAASALAPDGMSITNFELEPIPFYNEDVEAKGLPQSVQDLHKAIDDADGILIATPEYQHSIPGVLKNALDWASRPPGKSTFRDKAVAICGASTGMVGTARAQTQLRQVLTYNRCFIVGGPEVLVGTAHKKFDEDGNLNDAMAQKFLTELLENLRTLAQRISSK